MFHSLRKKVGNRRTPLTRQRLRLFKNNHQRHQTRPKTLPRPASMWLLENQLSTKFKWTSRWLSSPKPNLQIGSQMNWWTSTMISRFKTRVFKTRKTCPLRIRKRILLGRTPFRILICCHSTTLCSRINLRRPVLLNFNKILGDLKLKSVWRTQINLRGPRTLTFLQTWRKAQKFPAANEINWAKIGTSRWGLCLSLKTFCPDKRATKTKTLRSSSSTNLASTLGSNSGKTKSKRNSKTTKLKIWFWREWKTPWSTTCKSKRGNNLQSEGYCF